MGPRVGTPPTATSGGETVGGGSTPLATALRPAHWFNYAPEFTERLLHSHQVFARDAAWTDLSSKHGDLPEPGPSTQQTGNLIADLDQDGTNDFVLSFRQKAPALVAYHRNATGWDRHVIEPDFLTVEAGGAAYDIDGDGDLDIVFGGDWQSNELWWWENPGLKRSLESRWKRHIIKKGGQTQHHDQVFGDFKATGRAQLVFWNHAREHWMQPGENPPVGLILCTDKDDALAPAVHDWRIEQSEFPNRREGATERDLRDASEVSGIQTNQ
jgi:hypothetical protein